MWNLTEPDPQNQRAEWHCRARGEGMGKGADVGQRAQTCSFKMNKLWGSNVRHGDDS